MKTRVFITIDTEFSIGGAFEDPVANKPIGPNAVLCNVHDESHGLGFLLNTFAAHGTKATFFVEAFNSYFFGDAPMAALAHRIRNAGHDTQLHLHPCWTYFKNSDWQQRLLDDPPTDHMHGRSREQIEHWLRDGLAIFERWGLPRPTVLRTGSMMADATVYEAMQAVGMRVASNIGLAMYRPESAALHFYSGLHRVGDVIEACVLTYSDFALAGRVHHKSLTITGASWAETKALLLRAHESGLDSVVILTHPFEFVKYNANFTALTPNRANQRRLSQLCAFLRNHEDSFESATLGDLAQQPSISMSKQNVVLKAPIAAAIGRVLENKLNDLNRP